MVDDQATVAGRVHVESMPSALASIAALMVSSRIPGAQRRCAEDQAMSGKETFRSGWPNYNRLPSRSAAMKIRVMLVGLGPIRSGSGEAAPRAGGAEF